MRRGYQPDLAYVHDIAFSDLARSAAHELLPRLRASEFAEGLVVDLGCGGGRLARLLTDAGYDVLGVDLSPAMIRLARRHAPRARFTVASLHDVEIPSCQAVTAIGEAVNYAFVRNSEANLKRLFRRVYRTLDRGGCFLFDAAGPGQLRGSPPRTWIEGSDWALFLEKVEDTAQRTLTRRIVLFRRVGTRYRRSEEVHRLRLFPPGFIVRELRLAGFQVQLLRSYAETRFLPGVTGFVATKP